MAADQVIEDFLNDEDNKALVKPITEAFEWLSNKSTALILMAVIGEKISSSDVAVYKRRHLLSDFQKIQSGLNIEKLEDANKWFLLDAIHKTRLDPGRTGSMAALQALKNVEDIQKEKEERDPSAAILNGLINFIADNDKITADVKREISKEIKRLRNSMEK